MEWQSLDDDEIETYLGLLEDEILQKKLDPDYIRNLILVLIYISNIGFSINFNAYVEAVIANLKQTRWIRFSKEELFAVSFVDDQLILVQYNDILKPIYNLLDEKVKGDREKEYQFLIHNEWTKDFKVNCQNKIACFMSDKRFLSYVNSEEVLQKLKTASSAEICYFTSGIRFVYKPININEFYESDVPNIDAIVCGIEAMSSFDSKVKSWNIQQLKNLLIKIKGYLSS